MLTSLIYFVFQDAFVRKLRLERSSEKLRELETSGGFYTEQEMKDELKFTTFFVPNNIRLGILLGLCLFSYMYKT